MTRSVASRSELVPVLVAGVASLAWSILLLPHTPGIGDSAEFTLALAGAGIPHPTGYPFYVLAGHVFVRVVHALGAGWPTAANLWSALGAAVAAAAYVRLTQRVLAPDDGPTAPAAVRAAALALPVTLLVLHPVWIESATTAEVYSWSHAWLAIAAAWTLGRLARIDASDPVSPLAARDACVWGLLAGLGLAHHALALFFVVPLTLALVAAHLRAGGSFARLLPMATVGLPPLAGGLWLGWRAAHPTFFQWPLEPNAAAVIAHMTGAAYRGYLGGFAPRPAEWAIIRDTLLPWVLPGLIVGTLVALRARGFATRLGLLALGAGAASVVAFVTLYGVPDPALYFLPPLMVALLVVAPGVRALARRGSPRLALAAAAGVALLVLATSLPVDLRARRRLDGIDARIRAAWALVPFERGVVLWDDDHVHRLLVFQLLERSRPGIDVESPSRLSWPDARAAFVKRWRVDPFGGVPVTNPEQIRAVSAVLRVHLAAPVVDFPELLERVPRVAP